MADDKDDTELELTDDEAQQLLSGDDGENEKKPEPEKPERGTEQLGDAGKQALERMKSDKRAAEKELAQLRSKLKSFEDKDKTELERLSERATAAETAAAKATSQANAMRIAMDTAPEHATLAQVKAVARRIRGDDDDALETDAKELFEMLAPEPKKSATPGKPREKLRGGSEPDEEPEETDGRKIAARIPRSTIL